MGRIIKMIKRDSEWTRFTFIMVITCHIFLEFFIWLYLMIRRLLRWTAHLDNGERYMTSLGTPRAKFPKRLRDDIQS
jgi:hypothetical protein